MSEAALVTLPVITDEELERLPRDGRKYEIVNGELRAMSPAGLPHEQVVIEIAAALHRHIKARGLGRVYGSNVLYMLRGPFHGRSPDVSFIGNAKQPAQYQAGSRLKVATIPDLVVEMASPANAEEDLTVKVAEYLMAGVGSVWVVGQDRTVTIYHPGDEPFVFGPGDTIIDESVLPGFACPVADFFD